MVTVDPEKCVKCGLCISRFAGYCISGDNGKPVIDYAICNQCQKCIAICPAQAFLMNNVPPKSIKAIPETAPDVLKEVLRRRRSIKKFKDKKIPESILRDIAGVAAYAPNQNKNIDIIIVNDRSLLEAVDQAALNFFGKIYNLLFSFKPFYKFIQLFSDSVQTIKKKMEYDLIRNRHILRENTGAIYLAVGNPHVPVTETSAQYLLAAMLIYAESLGIGSCLMDSLKLSIKHSRKIRKRLGIMKNQKVLGVLAVGYADEEIRNEPQGYEIRTFWNSAT